MGETAVGVAALNRSLGDSWLLCAFGLVVAGIPHVDCSCEDMCDNSAAVGYGSGILGNCIMDLARDREDTYRMVEELLFAIGLMSPLRRRLSFLLLSTTTMLTNRCTLLTSPLLLKPTRLNTNR